MIPLLFVGMVGVYLVWWGGVRIDSANRTEVERGVMAATIGLAFVVIAGAYLALSRV